MFSRFFVRRPVFAWVIALLIMMAGIIAIRSMAVAQYPEVAPRPSGSKPPTPALPLKPLKTA